MKTALSVLAMFSILLGMVSMVTPIPGGTLLIAGGLTMLICSNPTAQYCLMWMRSRVNWVNKAMLWLECKVGTRIQVMGDALLKTRPPEGGTALSHESFVKQALQDEKEP